MNSVQRQKILDAIVKFQHTDIETPFQNKYKNTATIETVTIADYSIAELFALTKITIQKLNDFLEDGNWQIIPCDNINLSSYGTISLNTTIEKLRNNFISASYENAAQSLKALIYFEMQCGIWFIDNKITPQNKHSLVTEEEKLKLLISHATIRQDEVNSLIKELNIQKEELNKLIKSKKDEFEKLKSNQSDSNTIIKDIKNIQSNIENLQNSITKSEDTARSIIGKLNESQNTIEEQITTNENNITKCENALHTFNEEAKTKLSNISADYNQVSTYTNEVRKMMHFINDGTLAHSFNTRKIAIGKSAFWWRCGSFVGFLILCLWIYFVYTHLQTNTVVASQINNETLVMLISHILNIGKISPCVALLWFILSQYKKERDLLEEYAFRETVAATLLSYLDQLDGEDNKNKCSLLINTVEKLYTQPKITLDKNSTINTKDFNEIAKILSELIKKINNPNGDKF